MSYQRLIQSTLTAFQARKLLTISKHRLNRPAPPFALHYCRQVGFHRIRHQILPVPVAVFDHDQPDVSVLRRIHRHCSRSKLKMPTPLQLQLWRQIADRLLFAAPDHMRFRIQRALPGQAQTCQAFGKPASGIVRIADNVVNRQSRANNHTHQLLSQLLMASTFPIAPSRIILIVFRVIGS